jgi:hypothetical protein
LKETKRLLVAAVRPPLGGSFVASVLMRETVACGRWKREDLSAVGWKAVFSVAERERTAADRESKEKREHWCWGRGFRCG